MPWTQAAPHPDMAVPHVLINTLNTTMRDAPKDPETREVIVGGVLGPITHPDVVIAGVYTADGELVNIGRTVPLKLDHQVSSPQY